MWLMVRLIKNLKVGTTTEIAPITKIEITIEIGIGIDDFLTFKLYNNNSK
jgi:hypothetical protein